MPLQSRRRWDLFKSVESDNAGDSHWHFTTLVYLLGIGFDLFQCSLSVLKTGILL